ncbi:MAG: hypothetical protein IPP27_18885 [Bacteroidetes bacterium]|nr:hypothetical protein [Bacteroidota bacterium]
MTKQESKQRSILNRPTPYNYITSNLDLESLAPSTLGNPDPTLVELIAKLKSSKINVRVCRTDQVPLLLR